MEIITPFQLYLILQLDSFNTFFVILFFAFIVGVVFKGIAAGVTSDARSHEFTGGAEEKTQTIQKHLKHCYMLAGSAMLALLMWTVLPSTKVMAAILVVPAIVNNETVQQEAGELYALAKQAMADAVSDNDVVPEEPATTEEE